MGQPSGLALAAVAWTRCGGGYLMECLNSHPLIQADSASYWKKKLRHKINPVLVRALLGRTGCRVSATKLLCTEAGRIPDDFWAELQVRFIFLKRENIVRCTAASLAKRAMRAAKRNRGGAGIPFAASVDEFISLCGARCGQYEMSAMRAAHYAALGCPVLHVTYAEIVGREGKTATKMPQAAADRILEFVDLGPGTSLCPLMRRNHPHPLRAMIANWGELEQALQASDYARWLDDEAAYQ